MLALDESYLYATDSEELTPGEGYRVLKVPMESGPEEVSELARSLDLPTGLTVDAEYVYWGTESGSIMRLRK